MDDPYSAPKAELHEILAVPAAGMRWGRIGVAIGASVVAAIAVGFLSGTLGWELFFDERRPEESAPVMAAATIALRHVLGGLASTVILFVFLQGVHTRRWLQLALVLVGYWLSERLLVATALAGSGALTDLPWTTMGRDAFTGCLALGIDSFLRPRAAPGK